MDAKSPSKPSDDWLRPAVDQSGLKRFIDTVQAKLGLVLAIVAATVSVAVIYLLVANKVYEGEAKLLIQPIPAADTSFTGLGLIRESADPTLDIETAAQLVTTPQVADAAAAELDDGSSAESLLAKVRADPVGQSNIIAVVAEASTPERASAIANAFAKGVVDVRTDDLHERIDAVLPPLRKQLETLSPSSPAADSLAQQVTQLESLRAGPDPTFVFETPATPPDGPAWPRPLLTIIAAAVLGLALGAAAAFVARVLDPRLKREQQLRETFRLPVLARIPREAGVSGDLPLRPLAVSAPTLEAYRTLRATLTAPGPGGSVPRSFMVTSPSPSDGKTSTALNLAATLAASGARTILIESDLRRPMMARTLGFSPPHSITSVLRGEVSLTDALIRAPGLSENLVLLMADRSSDTGAAELLGLPGGVRMLEEARSIADCVVVDSPPLTTVIDALPFARDVDRLLIVVRLGKTHLRRIRELGELLAGNDITPAGFAVIGVARPRDVDYYYQHQGTAADEDKGRLRSTAGRAGSGIGRDREAVTRRATGS